MQLIPQTPDEAKKMVTLTRAHIGASLKAIGTISSPIAIETPLVIQPSEKNDAHWTALEYDGKTYTLEAGSPIQIVDGVLGLIRINKPSGNNVAVHLVRT